MVSLELVIRLLSAARHVEVASIVAVWLLGFYSPGLSECRTFAVSSSSSGGSLAENFHPLLDDICPMPTLFDTWAVFPM